MKAAKLIVKITRNKNKSEVNWNNEQMGREKTNNYENGKMKQDDV